MATVTFQHATRIYPGQDAAGGRRRSTSRSATASSSSSSVRPGAASRRRLRMLAGLEPIDDGAVLIGERDVTMVPPKDRDIAMVFQSYALYPHMTVAENIGFHLKITKVPKAEREQRVREAARILDLDDYLDRKPAKLSGGQRQRVAMGRAIVRQPQVFLMDEPLSNLDAKLRVQTRTQIAALQRRLGVTTVYVTHDQVEAMTMGDRVAVLLDGVLQQCATPRELFTRPVNIFVAGFIGSPAMNLLTGDVDGAGVHFGSMSIPLTPAQRAAVTTGTGDGRCPSGELSASPSPVGSTRSSRSSRSWAPSPTSTARVRGHDDVQVVARTEGLSSAVGGDLVSLVPDPATTHLFDTATGRTTPERLTATRPCPSYASTRTPAPPYTSSKHARTVPTCRRRAARSASAGSRHRSRTTCSGSRTDGRRWAATAARSCCTRRSTTPRSGRSASTASAR